MFVRLGLTNSLRQLGRSLLVLLAMTLSAMSLTSALSYSQINTKNSYPFYRQLLGGEILVAPIRWAGQQAKDITAGTALQPIRLPKTGLSWLERYYPQLYADGFLGTADSRTSQVIPEETIQHLASEPGISGYGLQYQFPASLTNATHGTEKYTRVTVQPLPDPERLAKLLNRDITPLLPYLEGDQPFAVVNSHLLIEDGEIALIAGTIPDELVTSLDEEVRPTPEQIYERKERLALRKALEGRELPDEWEVARLSIPTLAPLPDGSYLPNYAQAFQVDIPVFSQVSIPTRTIYYTNEMGGTVSETAYLHGGYVWLPQKLWQSLWQRAAQGGDPASGNLVLRIENMDDLEQTVARLQSDYPQLTFVSVADFAYRMEHGAIIDRFYNVPKGLYQAGETRLAVPVKLGKVMGLLFYLIAGMLIASRMLTGAAARRSEIGILKALGARKRDIAAMVLTESLLVTLIGASAGFLLVRMGGVIVELGNRVALQTVFVRTASEFGLVVGAACLVSLLFGLLPAIRMSNLTVMGVLRGE